MTDGWNAAADIREYDLRLRFAYHPARDKETQDAHTAVREKCLELALALGTVVPNCHEFGVAIQRLEEVMFWANAAVARSAVEDARR